MAAAPGPIRSFVEDAKSILAAGGSLEENKAAVGKRLSELSRRDDLTRLGLPLGASDASTENYLLWREPPATALVLGQFDPGYLSPVHEHGEHWVIGCGYRGEDRWDMYERVDDGTRDGFADVRLVDQWAVPPGRVVHMPSPPRAIHSHNNVAPGLTQELVFSVVPPLPPERRTVYDVEGQACWPSPFDLGGVMVGDHYPPRPTTTHMATTHPAATHRVDGARANGAERRRLRLPRLRGVPACCVALAWAP